jgi:hypothetical protein
MDHVGLFRTQPKATTSSIWEHSTDGDIDCDMQPKTTAVGSFVGRTPKQILSVSQ